MPSHFPAGGKRPTQRLSLILTLLGLFFLTLTVLLTLLPAAPVSAAPPEPTEPPNTTPWLSLPKPELPANPLLADKGAIPFWGICMACHGDKGQGLTDEWRERGFGEDMNCWKSRCHASNHPPEGFVFPHVVPAVIGPGTLKRFTTALELQQYILKTMPWWNPGSLSVEDSWALTAFLLRENGVLPRNTELDTQTAAAIPVHVAVVTHRTEWGWQYLLAGLLGLAAVTLVAMNKTKNTEQSNNPIGARPSFFHHLHPPTIPLPQARWRYTLGAGGLAIFLTLVLGLTGILEMFFYVPTPQQAGLSIQAITFIIPYGGLIRNIHFWAAQALVIVAVIHLLRVVFTGAFVLPRRFNFILGIILLVITLFMNFTGYVLRWDEGIRWALTVGTNLLKTIPLVGSQVYGFVIGGARPGPATLTRFYAWHIFGLTLIMLILIGWHIFRVRRDGGIAAPTPEKRSDPRRITRFELVRREVLAAILATAVLLLVGTLVPAPLGAPIQDFALAPLAETRAPWFFLWIQQMLRYGDAFWLGVGLPLGMLAVLVALPYLLPAIPEEQKGRWFPRAGRWAQILVAALALAWLALTVLEVLR
jgi:quinol-cytochrome oxidoreductase complex cytochrome b subunit